MTTVLLLLLAVLLTSGIMWASSTATRLHRLHVRTESLLAALQFALDRRVAVLAALDADQFASLAHETEAVALHYDSFEQRTIQERKVAECIRTYQQPLPPALVDAEARVQLAHRFYNEAVTTTRSLRVRPLVKALRLGGTAALPPYFELPI